MIKERLRAAREAAGITKAEASRRLGLSKIGYCRYEYGERIPSAHTIEAIAQCFGTSVKYLTGESDDTSPDYMLITKSQEPDLYSLVEFCRSTDEKSLMRLLAYYRKLSDGMKETEVTTKWRITR